MSNNLGRSTFLLSGAAVLVGASAPRVSGRIWTPGRITTPQTVTPAFFAKMRAHGMSQVIQRGYVYRDNGQIIPYDDCGPECQGPGNPPPYEPGGGIEPGPAYPVIGSVVANPYVPPQSMQFGQWTGTDSPTGPYLGGIPQHHWGPIVTAKQAFLACGAGVIGFLSAAVSAVKWCIANVQEVGTAVKLSAEAALAKYGTGTWAVAAAAEFFEVLVSFLDAGALLALFDAIGVGGTALIAIGALVVCVNHALS